MNLHDYLVDIVKKLCRKVLKSKVLSSFSIHFQNDVLPYEISTLKNIPKSVEQTDWSLFRYLSHTNRAENVKVVSIYARRGSRYSAVVLIIWDHQHRHRVTPEFIILLNAKIQKSFCFSEVIFAKDISTILSASNSCELTIGVLDKEKGTLNGLNIWLTLLSNVGK